MVLDARAKRLLDMLSLSRSGQFGTLTIDARRAGFEGLMRMGARPAVVTEVRDLLAGGCLPMRVYRDTVSADPAALVFFHGGGLVAGSIETHDGICRSLAKSSGASVFSVGYRLAPENKFPAALEDAAFAVGWIAEHADDLGIDAARIAIGGDSAGALLAALICNGHQPVTADIKAQLLLCPVLDLMADLPSRRDFGSGYLIDATTIAQDIRHCLVDTQSIDALPSALIGAVQHLPPPTVIVAAEFDPFRDEASIYHSQMQAAGVPVRYSCHPGMVHSFYGLPALLRQAEPALAEAGRSLSEFLR